jgi:hypothetical protein
MATINQGSTKTYVTISKQEAEWLGQQTSNYSGGLYINVWAKGNSKRLYVQLSGKKDSSFFDMKAETLETGMSLSLAKALTAFIEAQMPAVEATETEVTETVVETTEAVAVPNFYDTYTSTDYRASQYSDEEIRASMSAPLHNRPVKHLEAVALREGKKYQLSQADIERLYDAMDWLIGGFDGNENDPFIITGIARGMVTENPKYIAELERNNAQIEAMKQQSIARGDYHEGIGFSVGVGMNHLRWILTVAGRQWAKENLR